MDKIFTSEIEPKDQIVKLPAGLYERAAESVLNSAQYKTLMSIAAKMIVSSMNLPKTPEQL